MEQGLSVQRKKYFYKDLQRDLYLKLGVKSEGVKKYSFTYCIFEGISFLKVGEKDKHTPFLVLFNRQNENTWYSFLFFSFIFSNY